MVAKASIINWTLEQLNWKLYDTGYRLLLKERRGGNGYGNTKD